MGKQSAGLWLYREKLGYLEVLLVHPGGPFWANKDDGAWSIPKGEFDAGEDPLEAAKREFQEETSFVGTQAQRIAAQYGLQHLSTGDMLRDNAHRDTELARQAKLLISRGSLVPDDVVLGMVRDRIAQSSCENGFVLDGFPRTLPQAQGL